MILLMRNDYFFRKSNNLTITLNLSLNALHDGYAKNLITKTCSESSNYIMIPAVGLFINNLTNLNYFSNCSKTMIKSFVTPSDRYLNKYFK